MSFPKRRRNARSSILTWAWMPTQSLPSQFPNALLYLLRWHEELTSQNRNYRRPANHPTPNTRFLNNIVRATNNHNRNLLAQERADSQARLNDLDRVKQEKQRTADERERRLRPGPHDTRKRILGDIRAIIGATSKKRKVNDGDGDDSQDAERDRDRDSESRKSRKLSGRHDDRDEAHRHSRRRDGHGSSRSKDGHEKRELFADHGPRRGLAREEHDEEDQADTESRRHRHRRTSRDRSRRRGTRGDRSRERTRGNHEDKRGERDSRHHGKRSSSDRGHSSHRRSSKKASPKPSENGSDSDPLDDIIGPKPPSPVRRRGRGAISGSSGIEGRFASDYDPKADVSLAQEEDDDWGTALEALRDRARWKQQGAERLRAAGFTDEQVTKWEKGGEKSEEDVRWRKKGEEREWDRGKTLFKESDGNSS